MLETYPQENMNTQAIRELTNEVFNLKSRILNAENAISEAQSQITQINQDILIENITVFVNVTVPAGDATSTFSAGTAPVHEGYIPKAIHIRTVLGGSETILNNIIPYFENVSKSGNTYNIGAGLRNLGNADTDVKGLRVFIWYKKITD